MMDNELNNNETNEYSNNQAQSNTENLSQNTSGANPERGTYSYTGDRIIQDNHQSNFNQNSYNQSNFGQANYSQTNYGSINYGQSDDSQASFNQTVDPTPEEKQERKHKGKSRFVSVAKLTAAALAFGIIAGGAFQAYYMLAWSKEEKLNSTVANSNLEVTAVTPDVDKDTAISTSNTSKEAVVTDVSDVVAKVMPSIVAINSKVTATTTDFFGREFQQEGKSSGSGIIIGQNNSRLLIVTNNHVIDGATNIEIVFSDEKTVFATVKGTDANADLAVLSVDMDQLSEETANTIKVATLGDSTATLPGEMVIAIGNALGYGQSVTVGYVSAVNREVTIDNQKMTLLQTDAAINPGNSGGALMNIKGEVIGINSVKFASQEVEGMGYAIPISSAVPLINELMNRELVSASEQGFLGIDASTAQEVTEIYSQRFNMPIGIYVNDVIEDSPAAKAGLMQGDIITGLDGVTIKTISDLKSALSYKKAGQTVDLTIQVMEDGAYIEKVLKITLDEKQ